MSMNLDVSGSGNRGKKKNVHPEIHVTHSFQNVVLRDKRKQNEWKECTLLLRKKDVMLSKMNDLKGERVEKGETREENRKRNEHNSLLRGRETSFLPDEK